MTDPTFNRQAAMSIIVDGVRRATGHVDLALRELNQVRADLERLRDNYEEEDDGTVDCVIIVNKTS